jgi:hypothetical protein
MGTSGEHFAFLPSALPSLSPFLALTLPSLLLPWLACESFPLQGSSRDWRSLRADDAPSAIRPRVQEQLGDVTGHVRMYCNSLFDCFVCVVSRQD